ncbi:MAG: SpoIIE family protein phosphatase [Acidobacteriota bacterium]|nr:MAG: SpoIIE family protein phosphatase [Acidobacteriota bacterium]
MSKDGFGFRSLTWQLTLWILATVGLVYLGTLFYSNLYSRNMMLETAEQEAYSVTMAEIKEIQSVLRSVEEGTKFLATVIEVLEPNEDELHRALSAFAAGDERIYGSAAGFEPYAFDPSTERFCPYYYVAPDGSLASADLATDSYRYWEHDWYTSAAESGEAQWSDPYVDEGGGATWMITHSEPFYRDTADGRELRGIATADVSLDWIHKLVKEITVGESGYGVILSREGQIISHPDETLMREIAADPNGERRPEVEGIVASMLRGESGFEPFDDRYLGKRTRLTYAPVHHAGWSLAIVYPEDELLADVRSMLLHQLGLLLVGLVVLVGVVVTLSRRLTQPIKELAAGARQIATGDLDSELPTPRYDDEIGALTQSLRNMRDSLKTYIQDLKETTAAKQKLQSELQIAHNIQMDMLPKGGLGGDGERFELAATLVPARQVGGDLYYYYLMDDGRVAFLVGDVSGKGVPAALFMARTKTLFETIAGTASSVGAALSIVNERLAAENEAGMFVTVFAGVFEPATGRLFCASGGHDAPVLIPGDGSASRFLEIEGGPLIGLLPVVECPTNELTLAPGDAIVVSTDGVFEARDIKDEFFSEERLLDAVAGKKGRPAAEVTDELLADVKRFAGEAEQSDDITIMTLRYKG